MTMQILASFATPKAPATCAGRVILAHVPESLHPFVTWWENTELGGRCWGHYFASDQRDKAEADFRDRCHRGY